MCRCSIISLVSPIVSLALGCSAERSTTILPFLEDCGEAKASITALAFSDDSSCIYVGAATTGSLDGSRADSSDIRGKVTVVDLIQQSKTAEFETSLWPTAISITPNQEQLIVGYGRCVFDGSSDSLSSISMHSDTGRVVALDPIDLKEQHRINLLWSVYALSISPNGQLLAIQGANRKGDIFVCCYQLKDWKEVGVFQFDGTAAGIGSVPIQTLQFSPDNRRLIAATVSRGSRSVDDYDGDVVHFSHGEAISDGLEKLRNGRIVIIDLEQQAIAKTLIIAQGPVSFLNMSANGESLAFTAGEGCFLADLDLKLGVLSNIVNVLGLGVAFFADSSQTNLWRFTTASHPGGTGYWCGELKNMASTTGNSVPTVALGRNKECNWARITAVAMSKDGKFVATGDQVGSVFVWSPKLSEDQ